MAQSSPLCPQPRLASSARSAFAPGPAVLWALLLGSAVGSPNHDAVQAATRVVRSPQRYGFARRLGAAASVEEAFDAQTCEQVHQGPFTGGIRIGFELLESDDVPEEMRRHITEVVLPRAADYWSRALRVRRATEPLRVERRGVNCMRYALAVPGMQGQVLTAEGKYTCESAEPPTCGDEQLRVPDKYIKKTTICSKHCPQVIETFAHLFGRYDGVCDNCTTLPEGPGAVGFDFFAFVTIRDGKHCGDWTAAHAASCVTDQCDRPIFAHINFCQSKVLMDPESTDTMVSTAVHELAHALGFSTYHFQFFRNADGTPKAPRESMDPGQVKDVVTWSCNADGTFKFPDPQGYLSWYDLSRAGVLEKFNERGMDSCPCPLGLPVMYPGCIQDPGAKLRTPRCVFKVVTPKVREKVREFFDCPWLPGAEMENQPGTPCTIVGSHWEERIFRGELMTPGLDGDYIYLSPVTLALFEDSGWYLPYYDMADTLVKGVHWGYHMGCAFATEKCVKDGVTDFPKLWCTEEDEQRCSYDRKGQAACAIGPAPEHVPSTVRYFSKEVVGSKAELDYCPYFATRWRNRDCTSVTSVFSPISNANVMREVFSKNSRCLESTMRGAIPVGNRGRFAPMPDPALFAKPRPACFVVQCSEDAQSYEVSISDLAGSTVVLGICSAEGQTLNASRYEGEVHCAAPAELCGIPRPKHRSLLYEARARSWWRRTGVQEAGRIAAVVAAASLILLGVLAIRRSRRGRGDVARCASRQDPLEFSLVASDEVEADHSNCE